MQRLSEMSNISDECKKILLEENIDIFSEIDFKVNSKVHTLSFEYIVDICM